MKRWQAAGLLVLAFSVGMGVAYAATVLIFQASITLTVSAPNLTVQDVTVNGANCPIIGSTASCSGGITQGSTATFTFSFFNPSGSVTYTAASATSIPTACGMTSTDSSTSVAPKSTGSFTVTISAPSSASVGLQCTIGVDVNQS